jgi:hypothetical protein
MQTPLEIRAWDGMDQLSITIRRCGFLIPDNFSKFMAQILNQDQSRWGDGLRSYSRDYIRSGVAPKWDKGIGLQLGLLRKQFVFNTDLRNQYIANAKEWLGQEIIVDTKLQENWSPKKMHLRKIAQLIAGHEGLEVTKKGFVVSMPFSMQFIVDIDVGVPGSTVRQIVIESRIQKIDRSWGMWIEWSDLLPGMEFYMNGNDSASLIWGLKAFIAASKAFAASFNEVER